MSLVYDKDRVSNWADVKLGYAVPSPVHQAIGFEREGELVAAVCFDGYIANNVNAHIVSASGLLPMELLVAVGMYVFDQLKLDRMTFAVPQNNDKARALVEGLGGQLEATLSKAMKEHDLLLFVLWRSAPFVQKYLRRYH